MRGRRAPDGRLGISAVFMNGPRSERQTPSLLSHVTPLQVRRPWFISAPQSRCQPRCGPVWECNLGRIEHVTCDNVHPAREPEDHIDNVRFIRLGRASNYEQPSAEIGQRLFASTGDLIPHALAYTFSTRFNVIQVVCSALSAVCFLLNKLPCIGSIGARRFLSQQYLIGLKSAEQS